MMEKHGPADFIATTLGHVTTAVQGPGSVPKEWLIQANVQPSHLSHSSCFCPWEMKRRLPRPEWDTDIDVRSAHPNASVQSAQRKDFFCSL